MARQLFLYLFLLFHTMLVHAQSLPTSFETKVVGIKDGDTYVVLYNRQEITIRLEHIDCPEGGQAYGKNSKRYASDLCFGQVVQVEGRKYDRYKRLIAVIYVGKICINKEMVKAGYAWHFKKYSKDMDYDALEREAQRKKLGLWSDPKPIAPWDWRKIRKVKSRL
jgi:micrococcal nuclease